MSLLRAFSICLVLVVAVAPAYGFGWRWSRCSYSSPVVCYSVPVYVTPIRCVPITTAPAKMYAVPTPAPASQTKEPPLVPNAAPKVSESYYHERHYRAPTIDATTSATSDKCRVGFWNVTGRDVTLTIAGQIYTLPSNRSLTLDLGRAFTWHLDQSNTRSERIPDQQTAHEIVIRH